MTALTKTGPLVLLALALSGCGAFLGDNDDRVFSATHVRDCLDIAEFRASPLRREVRHGPPLLYAFDGKGDPFLQLVFFASGDEARTANRGHSPGASERRAVRGNIVYTWIGIKTATREARFDSCVPSA